MNTRSQPIDREKSYHHGALKGALLDAAEIVLRRDGLEKLTLRATAREAGVSHAAPKNHFDNLTGLLSDLAARGFERFNAEIASPGEAGDTQIDPKQGLREQGRRYVVFAKNNPDLFQLMFRNTRLDYTRSALKTASEAAFAGLTHGTGSASNKLDREGAVGVAFAWSLVHGYAMLMIDGQLNTITKRMIDEIDDMALLDALLGGASDQNTKKGPD